MRALIYVRISKDRTGAGLGVERQEQDCRELAALNGWQVVQVFSDNDISAYSGKARPGYDALLAAIGSNQADVVIAWHTDRLHRRNSELERYIAVSERAGVATYTVKAGQLDLATPAGRAIARTLGAWASYEVETSTARVKAAKLQQAQAGRWSGGQRPWGYEPGCISIRESEAVIVRELAARVTAGESFRSCALDLNQRGVTTTHGKQWNALKVRNLLSHKRYMGVREHHDAEYQAEWPAILTREQFEQLQAAIRLHARQYKQLGPARKFLLTGFAYCGLCGNRMNTKPRKTGESCYVCYLSHEDGTRIGCGKVRRIVAAVDLLITESIFYRLDTDYLAQLLHERDSDDDLKKLIDTRDQAKQRVDDLVEDYASGLLTRTQLAQAKATAEAALVAAEHQLEQHTRSAASVSLLPAGESVQAAWERNDLQWRRQLVSLLIERVVIHPSPTAAHMRNEERWNGWRFRPENVEIVWLV